MNRRDAVFGLSAALVGGAARAADCPKSEGPPPRLLWTERKAFTSGALAKDWLGARFKAPTADFAWPDAPIQGAKGLVTPRAWAGRTVLITLWAEWCTPCLIEMPALAALNARYAGRGVAIVPIVTGSQSLRAPADAARVLAQRRASAFEPLVDSSKDGAGLMRSLALTRLVDTVRDGCPVKKTSSSLPCLILIDPKGQVRGRSLGLPSRRPKGNVWEEPDGETFIKLLADGALA